MISSMNILVMPMRPWRTAALRSAPLALATLNKLENGSLEATRTCRRRHFSAYSSDAAAKKRFLSSRDMSLVHEPPTPPLQAGLSDGVSHPPSTRPSVPSYLQDAYWWAYMNPYCIRALDHQILVNIVLWGNFQMLRDATLDELCEEDSQLHGRTLQVACVYANFTESLAQRLAPSSTLDVIDVVPAQLDNLQRKLQRHSTELQEKNVTLSCYDAQHLDGFANESFDQVVLFLLLHEMPNNVRIKTLQQVGRVVKRGGKIVIMDYHRPDTVMWQTIMSGMYNLYEPFAHDMWEHEIQEWLPEELQASPISNELYFGGLYQKVVIFKE